TNACSRANGGCQQLCFYLGNNRKTCACAHGYLAQDGLRCNRYEGYLLSIHLSDENNLNSPIRAKRTELIGFSLAMFIMGIYKSSTTTGLDGASLLR
ncbi:hypothetical protein M9458_044212, partial [Cirrhinus mrigala]